VIGKESGPVTPDPYTRYVHIPHLTISLPCWSKLFR